MAACFPLILPYYESSKICVAMVLDLYVLSLNSMFSHLTKEEMEVSIEHDFATLNAKLELECSMKLQKTHGVAQEAN